MTQTMTHTKADLANRDYSNADLANGDYSNADLAHEDYTHADLANDEGTNADLAHGPVTDGPVTDSPVAECITTRAEAGVGDSSGVARRGNEAGMATAEYAIATVAAAGFAGLLLVILRSNEVRALLLGIIRGALSV